MTTINETKREVATKRYKINCVELARGGPGGYESVYLTSEGSPAEEELYGLISNMKGRLLPAEEKNLRQRNGSELVQALENNHKVGIASGFKPSGPYHFGHKLTSTAVSFFQKNGVQIFVPVADLECMLDKKLSKERSQFWAADNLVDWGANGVDLEAAHVYLQSEEFRVSNLAYLLSRELTFDLAIDTYGFEKLCDSSNKDNAFPFLFAGLTQVADILLPQHSEFGNKHSFMLSGQDQDGHMKMTIELAKRAFDHKTKLHGVQTIPSGLYIPHMRGLKGKASSSKTDTTIFLGPGPNGLDLEERMSDALNKLNSVPRDDKEYYHVERCALDMVRYIDFFNARNAINFREALNNMHYIQSEKLNYEQDEEKRSALKDEYLIEQCKKSGQDNVELIKETIGEALKEHQDKRKEVLAYAIKRAEGAKEAAKPRFWNVPQGAVVDPSKRNSTQWYHIVAAAKDKIIP